MAGQQSEYPEAPLDPPTMAVPVARKPLKGIDWNDSTEAVIKAELKALNQTTDGNKSQLIARLTAYRDEQRFEKFDLLPSELRRKIWNEALPRGRRLWYAAGGEDLDDCEFCWLYNLRSLRAPYNIMLTCKEAFAEVEERYGPGDVAFPWGSNPVMRRKDFSTKDDVLDIVGYSSLETLVRDDGNSFCEPADRLEPITLDTFKTLSFTRELFQKAFVTSKNAHKTAFFLLKLKSLSEIIIRTNPKRGQFWLADYHKYSKEDWGFGELKGNWITTYTASPPGDSATLLASFNKLLDESPKWEKLKKVKIYFAE